jgi:desert hedgehog
MLKCTYILGTLIVNDMAASCYSTVLSHQFAHRAVAPLRWWYRLAKFFSIEQPFDYKFDAGIHWLPKAMLQITEKYLPNLLTAHSL